MLKPDVNLQLQEAMDERDGPYMLQAIAWSRTARERGNRPLDRKSVV